CRMIEQLDRALAGPLTGLPRLQALSAIALASLCLEGLERRSEDAGDDLSEELDRQILADGGHVSRNPALLIDLLLDLLPLRETCLARGLEVPRGLVMAVDRIMPHLKLFRHSDGELALFNGMGLTQADVLATLVAYDDARGRAIEHAPYSGYDRMEAADSIAIVDTGRPPPRAHSAQAHAGTLAFEFSSNGQRLVINCGVPRAGTADMLQAARVTAAHSTLAVAERSSSRFGTVMGTRRVVAGPRDMKVAREGLLLEVSHDGYRKAFGIDHVRKLELSTDGAVLSGEDKVVRLSGDAELPCELRFHLHPALKVSLVQDGAGALMLTPSGEAWAFEAPDHRVTIEESVLFASADRMRRREQLVIRFDGAATSSVIWRFARIGTAPRRTPSTSSMSGDRLV
ncbi:MAG: heparinase II/III family protein, partial [Bosea sp. (in: a-proteobacteria)]